MLVFPDREFTQHQWARRARYSEYKNWRSDKKCKRVAYLNPDQRTAMSKDRFLPFAKKCATILRQGFLRRLCLEPPSVKNHEWGLEIWGTEIWHEEAFEESDVRLTEALAPKRKLQDNVCVIENKSLFTRWWATLVNVNVPKQPRLIPRTHMYFRLRYTRLTL